MMTNPAPLPTPKTPANVPRGVEKDWNEGRGGLELRAGPRSTLSDVNLPDVPTLTRAQMNWQIARCVPWGCNGGAARLFALHACQWQCS